MRKVNFLLFLSVILIVGSDVFARKPPHSPKPKPAKKVAVLKLALVDAKTGKKLRIFPSKSAIKLPSPQTELKIVATTRPNRIGSIQFVMDQDSASPVTFGTNNFPYVFPGDQGFTIPSGTHSLSATPYSGANFSGVAGAPLQIEFTIVGGPSPTPAPPPSPPPALKGFIGNNISTVSYYDAESLYTDAAKMMNTWGPEDRSGYKPASPIPFKLDSLGYPITDANTYSFMPGFPTGVYKASWDHDSNTNLIMTLDFQPLQPSQIVSTTDTVIDPTNNIHETTLYFNYKAGQLLHVHANRVDPNNPNIHLSNFHVIAPELDQNGNITYDFGSFSSRFLKKVQPFSVLRLMGFFGTNDDKENPADCPAINWQDRTLPETFGRSAAEYGTPGRQGGTYEEAAELSNVTGKDIWINVPDCATDDYITQMAQLFYAKLNPNVKLYVEFSNEVWNWGAGQIFHVMKQAKNNPQLTAGPDTKCESKLAPGADDTSCYFLRGMQQNAFQIVKIGKIFKSVFGSRASQIQPVLAAQIEQSWTIQVGLDYIKNTYGDPRQYVAYISGAPYVGIYDTEGPQVATLSIQYWQDKQKYLKSKSPADQTTMQNDLSNLFNTLFQGMHDYNSKYNTMWMTQAKAISDQYGIPLIAYEGGQTLVSAFVKLANQTYIDDNGNTVTGDVYPEYEPMHLAQTDPRMADVYNELFGIWEQNFGYNLFCHLNLISQPSNWGFWGLLETVDEDHSPKWDTVMNLIQQQLSTGTTCTTC